MKGTNMSNESDHFVIRIKKSPWYKWLFLPLWVLWLALWIEITVGSYQETEMHAYNTSLKILVISFLIGVIPMLWKRRQIKKKS